MYKFNDHPHEKKSGKNLLRYLVWAFYGATSQYAHDFCHKNVELWRETNLIQKMSHAQSRGPLVLYASRCTKFSLKFSSFWLGEA